MNILGMGPLELLVILALALVIFGPEKLPELGAQIGRFIRDFRRTTGELSEEFHRGLQLELDERNAARQPGQNGAASRSPSILPPPGTGSTSAPAQPSSPQPAPRQDDDLQPPY